MAETFRLPNLPLPFWFDIGKPLRDIMNTGAFRFQKFVEAAMQTEYIPQILQACQNGIERDTALRLLWLVSENLIREDWRPAHEQEKRD